MVALSCQSVVLRGDGHSNTIPLKSLCMVEAGRGFQNDKKIPDAVRNTGRCETQSDRYSLALVCGLAQPKPIAHSCGKLLGSKLVFWQTLTAIP